MIADYGAQQWAGIMFGLAVPPANFYVALCSDEPGSGWDGSVVATVEPTDSVYARQPIAVPSGFALADAGFVINTAEMDFPTPVEDWGLIGYYALLDGAGSSANLWATGTFIDPVYFPAGYPVSIPISGIFIGIGNIVPSIAE